MRDLEEARVLLAAAAADLHLITTIQGDTTIAPRVFGLHAQQCAEKCLKAWLCLLGQTYPQLHSLDHLLGELRRCGEDIAWIGRIGRLTPFAGRLKYTDPSDDPPLHVGRAVADAQAIYDHVSAILAAAEASEGRP